MNPLIGSSLYDSLNRLVIGILLSLLLLPIPGMCSIFGMSGNFLLTALYIILCFIAGVFFSFLIDRISESKLPLPFSALFYKNKLSKIRSIAEKYKVVINPDSDETGLEAYWHTYYTVQKSGLLGNIPALETLSAYLLNLCGVCLLYGVVCLIYLLLGTYFISQIGYNSCIAGSVILISFTILLISKFCRDYIENKIYFSVILAYKFLQIQDTNKK